MPSKEHVYLPIANLLGELQPLEAGVLEVLFGDILLPAREHSEDHVDLPGKLCESLRNPHDDLLLPLLAIVQHALLLVSGLLGSPSQIVGAASGLDVQD